MKNIFIVIVLLVISTLDAQANGDTYRCGTSEYAELKRLAKIRLEKSIDEVSNDLLIRIGEERGVILRRNNIRLDSINDIVNEVFSLWEFTVLKTIVRRGFPNVQMKIEASTEGHAYQIRDNTVYGAFGEVVTPPTRAWCETRFEYVGKFYAYNNQSGELLGGIEPPSSNVLVKLDVPVW